MEYSDIKDLISTVVDTDIMCFELNYKEVDIKIDRNKYTSKNVNTLANSANDVNVEANTNNSDVSANNNSQDDTTVNALNNITIDTSTKPTKVGNEVTSPIVGTFYASSSPTTAPFVEVGTKVKKGDVLFIVEAMKVINEIVSDYDGEVLEILAKDGELIEFAQPIVIIG